MIKYFQESFSMPFFILFFGLSALGLIMPLFLSRDELIPGGEAFWQYFALMLGLSIAIVVSLIAYAYTLRSRIGDLEKIAVGKFVWAFIGGNILCSLSLLPIAIVFLIFYSTFGPKVTTSNVREINLVMNVIFYPIFFPAFIYYVSAFSNCLLTVTATFSVDDALSIFSGKRIKPLFPSLLGIYGVPACLKLIVLAIESPPDWLRYIYSFVNMAILFLGVIFILYLTKSKAPQNTPAFQNGV